VHHQPVAGVVLDEAVAQQLPGLRRVVLLVEDRGACIRWRSEVEERVSAASAVTMAVMTQPCKRSCGPKSGIGTSGPGLITGAERSGAMSSSVGAVTQPIVGCAV
jgi:nitrogenase subunit NifH